MSAPGVIHRETGGIMISPAMAAFWLLMASSSFVLIEPAPFDLGFILLFGLFLLLGLRVPSSLLFMLLLLAAFLGFSVIGTARGAHFNESVRHVAITCMLGGVSVFIACMVHAYGERGLRVVMHGWTYAALAASLLGIAGYFGALGGLSDLFLLYGRAKGTFKDPNVLAPYLIVPLLYCIYEAVQRRGLSALIYLGYLCVLMLALLLSFSRGGWVHFALSGLIAFGLWLACVRDPRFRYRLVAFALFGALACAAVLPLLLQIESIGQLFEIRAKLTQDYDSSGSGRFAGQILSLHKMLDFPLGLGAHGFLPDWFEQPHNVYLYMFMLAGWGGGISYIVMVLLTMVFGFRALAQPSAHGGLTVVLIATFAGLIVEGFIVDTDHWRHFYVVMGALWGVYALAVREMQAPEAAPGCAGATAPRGT